MVEVTVKLLIKGGCNDVAEAVTQALNWGTFQEDINGYEVEEGNDEVNVMCSLITEFKPRHSKCCGAELQSYNADRSRLVCMRCSQTEEV